MTTTFNAASSEVLNGFGFLGEKLAAFSKIKAMTNREILKRLSPLTRSVGNHNVNRSMTIPLDADMMLPDIATELHIPSVNELCRRAVVFYLEVNKSAKTKEFKAALKQTTCACICLGFVLFIEGRSWRGMGDSEMRQSKAAKVRKAQNVRKRGDDEIITVTFHLESEAA